MRRVLWMFLASVGLTIFWLIPRQRIETGPTLCLISRMTGKTCPGCGMTRALHALLHGRFHDALQWNWRIAVVAPLLALAYLRLLFT